MKDEETTKLDDEVDNIKEEIENLDIPLSEFRPLQIHKVTITNLDDGDKTSKTELDDVKTTSTLTELASIKWISSGTQYLVYHTPSEKTDEGQLINLIS